MGIEANHADVQEIWHWTLNVEQLHLSVTNSNRVLKTFMELHVWKNMLIMLILLSIKDLESQ